MRGRGKHGGRGGPAGACAEAGARTVCGVRVEHSAKEGGKAGPGSRMTAKWPGCL